MLAFEAGIMHRDISEGNVMIANGRGFLHDFDYGFNWKLFLRFLDYEDTEESCLIAPLAARTGLKATRRSSSDPRKVPKWFMKRVRAAPGH